MITSKAVVGLKTDSLGWYGESKVFTGRQSISAVDSQVASRFRISDIFVTKNSLNKVDTICGLVKWWFCFDLEACQQFGKKNSNLHGTHQFS